MNLRELEYIVAVADLRSFSQAAQQCFVSQPTLSGQIKKLESGLGVKLFERTNKRVMPTEIGNTIIASARRVLNEISTIREAAEAAKDPLAGHFKLAAFPTLSSYLFPSLVPKLSDCMPKLKLILIEDKTDELISKLKLGSIDAAFLALPVDEDYFQSQTLFEDPFYLAVSKSHELAQRESVTQALLRKQKLLLLEDGHCLREQSLDVCQLMGITEDPDFRATSLETLREMVRANTGITLMPQIAIRGEEPGIHYLPFGKDSPFRTIGLFWRKTSARAQVINHIIEQFAP